MVVSDVGVVLKNGADVAKCVRKLKSDKPVSELLYYNAVYHLRLRDCSWEDKVELQKFIERVDFYSIESDKIALKKHIGFHDFMKGVWWHICIIDVMLICLILEHVHRGTYYFALVALALSIPLIATLVSVKTGKLNRLMYRNSIDILFSVVSLTSRNMRYKDELFDCLDTRYAVERFNRDIPSILTETYEYYDMLAEIEIEYNRLKRGNSYE